MLTTPGVTWMLLRMMFMRGDLEADAMGALVPFSLSFSLNLTPGCYQDWCLSISWVLLRMVSSSLTWMLLRMMSMRGDLEADALGALVPGGVLGG
eukprot:1157909-Pelagomonas_calceolata.AAC.4